jgi:hypothetical protein
MAGEKSNEQRVMSNERKRKAMSDEQRVASKIKENWMDLSAKEKVRSVLGTVRRILQRGYYKGKQ